LETVVKESSHTTVVVSSVSDNLYCVGGDVKPGSLTQSVKCVSDTGRPRSGK